MFGANPNGKAGSGLVVKDQFLFFVVFDTCISKLALHHTKSRSYVIHLIQKLFNGGVYA